MTWVPCRIYHDKEDTMLELIEKRLLEILNGADIAASLRAAELLIQLQANRAYLAGLR